MHRRTFLQLTPLPLLYAVGVKPTTAKTIESVSIVTKFELKQAFEHGRLQLYEKLYPESYNEHNALCIKYSDKSEDYYLSNDKRWYFIDNPTCSKSYHFSFTVKNAYITKNKNCFIMDVMDSNNKHCYTLELCNLRPVSKDKYLEVSNTT